MLTACRSFTGCVRKPKAPLPVHYDAPRLVGYGCCGRVDRGTHTTYDHILATSSTHLANCFPASHTTYSSDLSTDSLHCHQLDLTHLCSPTKSRWKPRHFDPPNHPSLSSALVRLQYYIPRWLIHRGGDYLTLSTADISMAEWCVPSPDVMTFQLRSKIIMQHLHR